MSKALVPPHPTDADRESRVDAAFLLLELAEARSGARPGGEQGVAAAFLSRMRDFAYAQGRADEREACAASMDKMAAHWRALLATYRVDPETPYGSVELAITMAQTYEGAALNIRARAAQEGASDGPA